MAQEWLRVKELLQRLVKQEVRQQTKRLRETTLTVEDIVRVRNETAFQSTGLGSGTNGQVAYWLTDSRESQQLIGNANLTFDGTDLTVNGAVNGTVMQYHTAPLWTNSGTTATTLNSSVTVTRLSGSTIAYTTFNDPVSIDGTQVKVFFLLPAGNTGNLTVGTKSLDTGSAVPGAFTDVVNQVTGSANFSSSTFSIASTHDNLALEIAYGSVTGSDELDVVGVEYRHV